jgi:hypothetical protein
MMFREIIGNCCVTSLKLVSSLRGQNAEFSMLKNINVVITRQ